MKSNKQITRLLIKDVRNALQTIAKADLPTPNDLPIREIRISLLDEDGEGVGLFAEYNEETGELERGMSAISEDDEFLSELESEFTPPALLN